MQWVVLFLLPFLLITTTHLARGQLDCPKGTYLTSDLKCNPYTLQKQPTNQNQSTDILTTWINTYGNIINSKIPNSTSSFKMGEKVGTLIGCYLTGNANKTLCK